jgi:hypothetical protein
MFATLLEHRHRFPNVEVRTVDGSHDQLLSALANSVVDIAIMTTRRARKRAYLRRPACPNSPLI